MAERHFTPAEVEALIPRLTAIMDRVRSAHAEATARQERLRAVRQRIELSGGGVIDRAAWRDDAAALERATAAVREGLDEVPPSVACPRISASGSWTFPICGEGRP